MINKNVFGIFGYIKLVHYNYLILIEEASIIGSLIGATIFRVEKLMFIPINKDPKMLVPMEDQQYVDMIENIQRYKSFYFSYKCDLTKSMQKTFKQLVETSKVYQKSNQILNLYPNSTDCVQKFVFNSYLLSEFEPIQYTAFRVPCIMGYVYVQTLMADQTKFDFTLISRKDCRRPGRRFVVRGLDRDGCAANFVETEHIFTLYEGA